VHVRVFPSDSSYHTLLTWRQPSWITYFLGRDHMHVDIPERWKPKPPEEAPPEAPKPAEAKEKPPES